MPPHPYRCEGRTPLFSTQNDVLHFVKDSVEAGHLRPCKNLKVASFVPVRVTQLGGYGPVCERDSFTVSPDGDGYSGYYHFYGCPRNCILYEEERRPTPWTLKSQPAQEPKRPPADGRSRSARTAWIAFAGAVIAALIVAGAQLWIGDSKPENALVAAPVQSATRADRQQIQTVQNAPASTNIQADQVTVIQSNAPSVPDAPSAQMPNLGRAVVAAALVKNGGFENAWDGWGTGSLEDRAVWLADGPRWLRNPKSLQSEGELDYAVKHGGFASLRITHVTRETDHAWGTIAQRITGLRPNTNYVASFWVKVKAAGAAPVFLTTRVDWGKETKIPGKDTDWTRFVHPFNPGNRDFVELRFVAVAPGVVWIDDVEIASQ